MAWNHAKNVAEKLNQLQTFGEGEFKPHKHNVILLSVDDYCIEPEIGRELHKYGYRFSGVDTYTLDESIGVVYFGRFKIIGSDPNDTNN